MNALVQTAPNPGDTDTISVRDAWLACGGNPDMTVTRDDVLGAMRINAKIADAASDQEDLSRIAATLETEDDATRERFEKATYHQYFLSTIERTPGSPFALMNVGTKTKAVFLARKPDGDYEKDSINGAWWAWRTAELQLLRQLGLVHRFVPLAVGYTANGRIDLPRDAPFDGKPVLLQTREGVVEASWVPEQRHSTGEGGTEVDGFSFFAERGSEDIELDAVLGWMPIPKTIPVPVVSEDPADDVGPQP